ncbi:MAG: DMT family transporter [Promethearchaeota archaeon]
MIDILTTTLGIFVAIISTCCFNFSMVLQKKGLKESSEIKIEKGIKNLLKTFIEFSKNKSWLTGTIIGLIGLIPYVIAMGMVGVVVVQPVSTIGLIIFVISAIRILKEKVSLFEIISIGMLVISPILIGLAIISDIRISFTEFLTPYLLFITIIILICVLSFFLSKKTRGTKWEGFFIMIIGSLLFSLGATFTNVLAQAYNDAHINALFFWEIIFGIFWLDYLHIWLFIGFWGMVIFNLVSIVFFQTALQKIRAVVVVPIHNAITLLVPVLAGLFIFHQIFENTLLFFVSIILILISIISLSRFQAEIESIK